MAVLTLSCEEHLKHIPKAQTPISPAQWRQAWDSRSRRRGQAFLQLLTSTTSLKEKTVVLKIFKGFHPISIRQSLDCNTSSVAFVLLVVRRENCHFFGCKANNVATKISSQDPFLSHLHPIKELSCCPSAVQDLQKV